MRVSLNSVYKFIRYFANKYICSFFWVAGDTHFAILTKPSILAHGVSSSVSSKTEGTVSPALTTSRASQLQQWRRISCSCGSSLCSRTSGRISDDNQYSGLKSELSPHSHIPWWLVLVVVQLACKSPRISVFQIPVTRQTRLIRSLESSKLKLRVLRRGGLSTSLQTETQELKKLFFSPNTYMWLPFTNLYV